MTNFVLMGKKKHPLGDSRLSRPMKLLLKGMAHKMTSVLRQAASNDSEEASFGLFINNAKVTPEGLCKEYWRDLNVDWIGRDLLIYEDSSTFVFNLHADRKDLTNLGPNSNKGGFQIHQSLLVDACDGFCFGVGSAQMSKYKELSQEQRQERRRIRYKTPFEEKETFRWYSTAAQTISNCPGAASYTVIGDREGDIYDVYGRLRREGHHFLFRASDDRRVQGEDGQSIRLSKFLEELPDAFCYYTNVSATKKRRAHTARLRVKYSPVRIPRPEQCLDKSLPEYVDAYVIDIYEDASSIQGKEPPVRWVLLSSQAVTCANDCHRKIDWYCNRWNIEQHFRSVKLEGLDVGHSEVKKEHALVNLSVLSLMASVKVMALVMGRDGSSARHARDVFTEEETQCMQLLNESLEGRTEKQKNPHPIGSFVFACWIIARLGGWKPGNKTRPPGPITMLNGLVEFNAIVKGYRLFANSGAVRGGAPRF